IRRWPRRSSSPRSPTSAASCSSSASRGGSCSERLMRAFVVFIRLLPFVVAFLRDRRRFILFGGPLARDDAHHRRRADRLTRTLAELGPTFIKLAQVFGARADILPEPY